MLTKEDYNLTKKELKIRKIWLTFYWILWSITSIILTLCLIIICSAIKSISDIELILGVSVIIILAFFGWWLFYYCAYKKSGVWLLRLQLIFDAWAILKAFSITSGILFFLFYGNIEKYSKYSRSDWVVLLSLLLIDVLFSAFHFYLGFRLLKINKKIRCTQQVSDDLLAKIQRLAQLEDGDQRSALYGSLVGDYPYLNWLISRVWKRKEKLITVW